MFPLSNATHSLSLSKFYDKWKWNNTITISWQVYLQWMTNGLHGNGIKKIINNSIFYGVLRMFSNSLTSLSSDDQILMPFGLVINLFVYKCRWKFGHQTIKITIIDNCVLAESTTHIYMIFLYKFCLKNNSPEPTTHIDKILLMVKWFRKPSHHTQAVLCLVKGHSYTRSWENTT